MTAVFTVVLLGRNFGTRRWMSLVVLTSGVSVVCLPSSKSKELALDIHDFSDHFFPRSVHEMGQFAGHVADAAGDLTKRSVAGLVGELAKRSATYEGIAEDLDSTPKMNYSIGVTAVVVAAVVSGLTGVYFEKLIKDPTTPVSVWTRNIQLSFYSLFPALIFGVIINDGAEIAKHGFFDGYNAIVWVAVVFQAVGGILVSLCLNYADNIAKNFATSLSIVISFLFSVVFFDFEVNLSVRSPWPPPPTSHFLTPPAVHPRHRPRHRRNIPVQPARPEARATPAHQHRQLREDHGRGHAAVSRSGPAHGQPAGIGPWRCGGAVDVEARVTAFLSRAGSFG
jgi:UDP-galactose transporter